MTPSTGASSFSSSSASTCPSSRAFSASVRQASRLCRRPSSWLARRSRALAAEWGRAAPMRESKGRQTAREREECGSWRDPCHRGTRKVTRYGTMPRFRALFRCQQPSVVETLIRNSRRNPLALPDVRAFAFSEHVASLALRKIVQNRAIGRAVAAAQQPPRLVFPAEGHRSPETGENICTGTGAAAAGDRRLAGARQPFSNNVPYGTLSRI